MTVNQATKSGLSLKDFAHSKVILKSATQRERRDGKSPLIFVEFINTENYTASGEMLFLNRDVKYDDIRKLEHKPVSAVLELGQYNGRNSISCVDIKPAE
jgi:hypothetical protein